MEAILSDTRANGRATTRRWSPSESRQLTQAEIARKLGISRTTVSDWSKKVEAEGIHGLRKRTAKGGITNLTKEQKQRLKRLLDRGALANGFSTDRWTLQRVQELIAQEFAVSLSSQLSQSSAGHPGFQSAKAITAGSRARARLGAGLAGARFSKAKKSRSGSAQNSSFAMNLVSPFKNCWRRLGRAKENDQFSGGSPLIAVRSRRPWR